MSTPPWRIGRRQFLVGALVLGSAVSITRRAHGRTARTKHPFTLEIASGYPRPTGVVLWTRLAPAPLLPGGGMPPAVVSVQWEVASDERMSRSRSEAQLQTLIADNPHRRFIHGARRGYVRVELTPARLRADLQAMRSVTDPGAGAETLASFVVDDGRPGAVRS